MEGADTRKQNTFSVSGKPLLFILSGPSGVGKDAVLNRLKDSILPLAYVVTATTRPPRKNERNNIEYTFISEREFRELIETGGLLEWANVYGNMYGVPRRQVEQLLAEGHDVMVKVDIQGADNIKRIMPESISIFLMPESFDDLAARLTGRKTETDTSLEIRLNTASRELERVKDFNYAVLNRFGEIEKAVSDIVSIITAEKCRVRPD